MLDIDGRGNRDPGTAREAAASTRERASAERTEREKPDRERPDREYADRVAARQAAQLEDAKRAAAEAAVKADIERLKGQAAAAPQQSKGQQLLTKVLDTLSGGLVTAGTQAVSEVKQVAAEQRLQEMTTDTEKAVQKRLDDFERATLARRDSPATDVVASARTDREPAVITTVSVKPAAAATIKPVSTTTTATATPAKLTFFGLDLAKAAPYLVGAAVLGIVIWRGRR